MMTRTEISIYTRNGYTRTATLDGDELVTVRTEREIYRTTLSAWAYYISREWEEYGWVQQ